MQIKIYLNWIIKDTDADIWRPDVVTVVCKDKCVIAAGKWLMSRICHPIYVHVVTETHLYVHSSSWNFKIWTTSANDKLTTIAARVASHERGRVCGSKRPRWRTARKAASHSVWLTHAAVHHFQPSANRLNGGLLNHISALTDANFWQKVVFLLFFQPLFNNINVSCWDRQRRQRLAGLVHK